MIQGIISEKLVTGIFIPQFKSTEQAYFKIIDPEFSLDFADVKRRSSCKVPTGAVS